MSKKEFSLEEAKQIGDRLGIDWKKYDLEQFRLGLHVELEHGSQNSSPNIPIDDELLIAKIVLAHLNEIPDYYTWLIKMESEAEAKK